MKKLIHAGLALLFVCSAIPAMAGEKVTNNQDHATFQALSKVTASTQLVLNKMTDEQLSKVEGTSYRVSIQKNISNIWIFNYNECFAGCGNFYINVHQSNR